MGPESRHNSNASDAFQILHTSIHSNTEALATLQQYISHLEELLLAELGAKELTRRLETLQDRDSDTLFIPEGHPRSRKRSSSSTESGSSPKKARSNSSASSLGFSSSHLGKVVLDKAKSTQSNVSTPNVSPKTSRKSSVSAPSVADSQQTTAQQIPLRSVHPRPQSRRGSQSVMLPNIQPSSNFHSGPSLSLAARTSQYPATAQPLQKQSSAMSMRKDSVHSDEESKLHRSGSMSCVPNVTIQHSANQALISTTPSLSRNPAFPATLPSSSANKQLSLVKDVSPSSNKLLSSASKPSPSSNKIPSSGNNPSASASKSSSFSNSSSGESSSVTRKPWRASKKG